MPAHTEQDNIAPNELDGAVDRAIHAVRTDHDRAVRGQPISTHSPEEVER